MNTYRVTFKNCKTIEVDAFSGSEAMVFARDFLRSWGYENLGKAKIEVIE